MAEKEWANATRQYERRRFAEVKHFHYKPDTYQNDAPDVLFVPGLFTHARHHSTKHIAQAFGEQFGGMTYAMSAELYGPSAYSIRQEAKSILQRYLELRKARGVDKNKPVVVVGHSRGGSIGISLTSLFEEMNIPVHGTVLIAPRGLNDEEPKELARRSVLEVLHTTDLFFRTPKHLRKLNHYLPTHAEMLELVAELSLGFGRTTARAKLAEKIEGCAKKNTDAAKIKSNIVIIHGESDFLADPREVIPALHDSEPYIMNMMKREKHLKEHIFTSSAGIRALVARHWGIHALPVVRKETVAFVADHMLRRMKESQKQKSKTVFSRKYTKAA